VPQDWPFGAWPPWVQTGEPVAHAMVAIWHEPPSEHEVPTAHAMHAPLLHTPASQAVPLKTVPSVRHVGAPPSQTVMPFTQSPA
jgi:hypothetical protein